jgi:hypothetical protein
MKADVLFFDRKPAGKVVECEPHLHLKLWIYDLRTNLHLSAEWRPCGVPLFF